MIAITGPSGFLGGHLARDLNSRKIPSRCLVRSVPSQGLNQNLSSFVRVDYDNQSSVDAALSGCDVLVHFLGLINGTEGLLHQVNVDYSRKILEAAKKAGIRRIVWVSSVAALRRHGYYGITKFEGEELLRTSGIPFTILQPAFIYGFGDGNNTAMLIRTLRRYPIVPLLGGGDFKLQPVYVDDVMRLIQSVLNDVPQDRAYIVAGPEQISPILYTEPELVTA